MISRNSAVGRLGGHSTVRFFVSYEGIALAMNGPNLERTIAIIARYSVSKTEANIR